MPKKDKLYVSVSQVALMAFTVAAFGAVPQAFAAQTAAGAAPEIEEVVVTGSRVVRDGYEAPTPVTVVGAETLERSAPAVLADALTKLPQFSGSTSTQTASIGSRGAGQAILNLRNLGAKRTLVLVDGQRVAPGNIDGSVDINTVPSGLVQRVDIVTGGASAAWGSDAVAGVVNFVLDSNFTGLKGQIQGGVSEYGDNGQFGTTLSYGTAIGDRGHIIMSAEYFTTPGISTIQARDWSKDPRPNPLVTNPTYTATNGQPRFYLLPYVYQTDIVYNGLIYSGPLKGTTFTNDGAPTPYQYGRILSGTFQAFDRPTENYFSGREQGLVNKLSRGSFFFRGSYDLTDSITARFTANYNEAVISDSFVAINYTSAPRATNMVIQRDNAFLDAATRARMVTANVKNFVLAKGFREMPAQLVNNRSDIVNFAPSLEGKFDNGWTWSAYFSHSNNRFNLQLKDVINYPKLAQSVDAVLNSAGSVVCRSTLTNPTNGCIPTDPFGTGGMSMAAFNWMSGTSYQKGDLTRDASGVQMHGDMFSTWAGPISFAVGGEYRKEKADFNSDLSSQNNEWLTGNYKPIKGTFSVWEGFGEVVVPLAKDEAWAKSLDLNAAARFTDYNLAGSVVTYKVGATYAPVDDIHFRATRSRDIRAPNINELFTGAEQTIATVRDPFDPVAPNASKTILQYAGGNTSLTPEKADTTSVGVVFQPSFLPGFSASIDYYNIDVKDTIGQLTLQDEVDRCVAGNQALCALFTRAPNGALTTITRPFLNVAFASNRGIDFDARYTTPLFNGDFGIQFLASYLAENSTSDATSKIDRAGDALQAGGAPHWRADLTFTYKLDPASVFANLRYVGSGKYDNTLVEGVDLVGNFIPSRVYLNVGGTWNIDTETAHYEVYLNMDNVADVTPPFPALGSANYDRIGRMFRAGLRFKY